MQCFEAAVGKEAVEGRGYGANGILEEGEAGFKLRGVEGASAH